MSFGTRWWGESLLLTKNIGINSLLGVSFFLPFATVQ